MAETQPTSTASTTPQPSSSCVKSPQLEFRQASGSSVHQPGKEVASPAYYECAICNEILLDPVVGTCGHDFCSSCLEQWRKASEQLQSDSGAAKVAMCPICRQPLSEGLGVCHRLKGILESCFPELLARRRAEAAATSLEVERRSQQFMNLQACVVARFNALLDLSTMQPSGPPPGITVSAPDLSSFSLNTISGRSISSLDASLLSTWEQELPCHHVAHAPSPCPSTRSSQCWLPNSVANLLNSTPAAIPACAATSEADPFGGQQRWNADLTMAAAHHLMLSHTPRQASVTVPHFATPPRMMNGNTTALCAGVVHPSTITRLPPLPPRRHALGATWRTESVSGGGFGGGAGLSMSSDAFSSSSAVGEGGMETDPRSLTRQVHADEHTAMFDVPGRLADVTKLPAHIQGGPTADITAASVLQLPPPVAVSLRQSEQSRLRSPRVRTSDAVAVGVQLASIPARCPTSPAVDPCSQGDSPPLNRYTSFSEQAFFTTPNPAQFMLQTQRRPERRPSEPGSCVFPGGSPRTLVVMGSGETKYTSAIKRMREEDDAADAAGRPRTSAMRRLFPTEITCGRGPRFSVPEGSPFSSGDLPDWHPNAIRCPSSFAHEPVVGGKSRSLSSPGCGSVTTQASAFCTEQAKVCDDVVVPAIQTRITAGQPNAAWPPPSMHSRLCSRRATSDGSVGLPTPGVVTAIQPLAQLPAFNSVATTPVRRPQLSFDTVPTPLSGFGAALRLWPSDNPSELSQGLEPFSTPFVEGATGLATDSISMMIHEPHDDSPAAQRTPANNPFADAAAASVRGTDLQQPVPLPPCHEQVPALTASPSPPLPTFPRTPTAATTGVLPSILQLATPVRTGRRSLHSDLTCRTCPSTPRARRTAMPNPFHEVSDGNTTLISALMLPRRPALTAPQTPPARDHDVSTSQTAAQWWSLYELVTKCLGRQALDAQPWHDRVVDKPVRSACSSALAAFFSDRFQEQLRHQPAGAVFLFVKAIEEHLYYRTATKQEYADLSTLQQRMVKAVDEMIGRGSSVSSITTE